MTETLISLVIGERSLVLYVFSNSWTLNFTKMRIVRIMVILNHLLLLYTIYAGKHIRFLEY